MPALARPPAVDPLSVLPEALQGLARRGELRRYRKGLLLIQEGDQGDAIYIVVAGRLRAFSAADNGRELTYGVYGPGEYLGEMSLDGGPRSASVETLEPCACVVINRTTLAQHLAEHPEFAFDLLAKVIRRARSATMSARALALNDVYGRLKALLDTVAGPSDAEGARPIEEKLTHQAMAQRLGCSREMVSRLMKDLERGHYIEPASAGAPARLLKALPARW
jgi:CRP/FNR family cyclic AMP-dependent transcriptional regulator